MSERLTVGLPVELSAKIRGMAEQIQTTPANYVVRCLEGSIEAIEGEPSAYSIPIINVCRAVRGKRSGGYLSNLLDIVIEPLIGIGGSTRLLKKVSGKKYVQLTTIAGNRLETEWPKEAGFESVRAYFGVVDEMVWQYLSEERDFESTKIKLTDDQKRARDSALPDIMKLFDAAH